MIKHIGKEFSPDSPFLYSGLSAVKINLLIMSLLLLQTGVLIFERDFLSAINIFLSAVSVSAAEIIFSYHSDRKFKADLSAPVCGLMMGFFMPAEMGFFSAFVLPFIAFYISKIIFGGAGANWVNPVMFAAAFFYICKTEVYPAFFSDIDLLKTNGGLFQLLHINGFTETKADMPVTSALNSFFLHSAGITLPDGYVSLFWNSTYPIPAFRYNLLTLLSSIILFAFKAADKAVSFVFIFSYALLVWVFGMVPVDGTFFSGDIMCALMTSGVLFTAFFAITEDASAPDTIWGKSLSGAVIGAFAFLICGAGASPAGLAFAVLLANKISPFIEKAEQKIQNKKRIKLWNLLKKKN